MAYSIDDYIAGQKARGEQEKATVSKEIDRLINFNTQKMNEVPKQFDSDRADIAFNTAKAQSGVSEKLSNLGYSLNAGLGSTMKSNILSNNQKQMAKIGKAQNDNIQSYKDIIDDYQAQKSAKLTEIDKQVANNIQDYRDEEERYQKQLAEQRAYEQEQQRKAWEQEGAVRNATLKETDYNNALAIGVEMKNMKAKPADIVKYVNNLTLDKDSKNKLYKYLGVWDLAQAQQREIAAKNHR